MCKNFLESFIVVLFMWKKFDFHNIYHTICISRWYVGDMSRQRAESLLKQEDKEGCFVVRNSSTKGLYTLSLFTKV